MGQGQQGADQCVRDLLVDEKGVGMGFLRFTSGRGALTQMSLGSNTITVPHPTPVYLAQV